MRKWKRVLELNEQREVVSGSFEALAAAVKRGAGLRSYSTFDYAEHMAVADSREGLVQESMSFGAAYWLEGGRTAGIQTMRYPANSALGFLDLPSLSFFLNNDNGRNGIARPFLDGRNGKAKPQSEEKLEKYRLIDEWDAQSPCPCENFTYDFGEYGWWVDDSWEEMLSHDEQGKVTCGSLKGLQDAFRAGRTLKVGVKDLCAGLAGGGETHVAHEVFVEIHSVYNHEDAGVLGGESQPLVRVAPNVPLVYKAGNWNYGWLLPRTDGAVHQLVVDPYTHGFSSREDRFAVRWFAQ